MRVIPLLHAMEDIICQDPTPDGTSPDTMGSIPFRCGKQDHMHRKPWNLMSNYPAQCESLLLRYHVGVASERRSSVPMTSSPPFHFDTYTGITFITPVVGTEQHQKQETDMKTKKNITKQLLEYQHVWYGTMTPSERPPRTTGKFMPCPEDTTQRVKVKVDDRIRGVPVTHDALVQIMHVPITAEDVNKFAGKALPNVSIHTTPYQRWGPPTLSHIHRWCVSTIDGAPGYIVLLACIAGSYNNALKFLKLASEIQITIRVAHVMYFLSKWIIPRDDQLQVVKRVVADLQSNNANVYSMTMGSGKTAVVTPMVLAEVYHEMLGKKRYANSDAVTLVLPPKLVRQSAMLLAVEFRAHTLVHVRRHCDWASDTPDLTVAVSDNATVKRQITRRAATVMDGKSRSGLQNGMFVFDEVDSLVNPLTSELNVPQDCPLRGNLCRPVVSLPSLFRAVYRTVQKIAAEAGGVTDWATAGTKKHWPLPLKLTNSDLKDSLQREFDVMLQATRDKRNRQHYGVVSVRDFKMREEPPTCVALPFTFAETPSFGSKFSSIMFSMIVTSVAYVAMDKLEAARAMELVDVARKNIVVLPGCNSEVTYPREYQVCQALLTRNLAGEDLPHKKSVLSLSQSDVAQVIDTDELAPKEKLHEFVRGMLWADAAKAHAQKVSPLGKEVSRNRVLVDAYAMLVVAKEFVLDTLMCNVSGIEMLLSQHAPRRSGFTGTPESLDSEQFDIKGCAMAFPPTEPAMAPVGLRESPVWVYKGNFLGAEGYPALQKEMQKANHKVRVIIDAGCQTLGVDLTDMFKTVSEATDGQNTTMLYWHADTSAPTLRKWTGDSPWSGRDDGNMSV